MKRVPMLIAIIVSIALYFLIVQRDRLLGFAGRSPDAVPVIVAASVSPQTGVRLVAITFAAQTVDRAVILRGRRKAARPVTVATETAGHVASDPLREGSFVMAGDMLCRPDPGTRDSKLAEAQARLAETESRTPEAQASRPASARPTST